MRINKKAASLRPSQAKSKSSSPAPTDNFLLLEKRIAFDAAGAATLAVTKTDVAHAPLAGASHLPFIDPARLVAAMAKIAVLQAADAAHAASTPVNQIVFVDGGLQGLSTLISDISAQLQPGAEIVILDPTKDGVDQMASVLKAQSSVQTVQIVSHGSAANLHLGTADLNTASMGTTYASDLASIKASLAPNAQILVYGCDFAQGIAGVDAARTFANATGASIAASTNLTGSAALGADWTLEYHTSTAPVTASFDAAAMTNWHYDLALTTSTYTWPAAATLAIGTPDQLTVAGKAAAITETTTGTGTVAINVGSSGAFTGGTSQNGLQLAANTKSATAGETATFVFNSNLYPQGVKTFSFDIFNIDKSGTNWSDKVIVIAYDTKGVVIPGSAITVTPLATPAEYTTTTNAGSVALVGQSTDATFNTPKDSPNISITSSTGSNIGRVTLLYVSGTANVSTGVIAIGTLTTVYDPSSVFTSAVLPDQAFKDSQSGISVATSSSFTDARGLAMSYSASGLPAGLTIDAATGVISGTIDHNASLNAASTTGSGATLDGKYTVTVTASDSSGGSSTSSFAIDSTNQAPVIGTKTADTAATNGSAVSVNAASAFSDPNTGDTITYAASGLPAGLTLNASTGVISGTLTNTASTGGTAGVYAIAVTATDNKGAATTESFNLTATDVAPVVVAAPANQTTTDSATVSYPTAASFKNGGVETGALTYAATGLPAGLALNAATGVISGTLDHNASTGGTGGVYTVSETVTDAAGKTTTTSFTITSTNQAPVIGTKTADTAATNGSAVSVNAASAFSDPNTGDTITYAATGLPAGLTINASTGVISGTLTNTASTGGTAGVYAIAVTATDNKGAATTESFNLTATDVAPVVVAAPANQTTTDSATVSYPTAASFKNGGVETGALSYAATGLPAGLTINASTGVISGTLDHNASTGGTGGVYTVSETVTDAAGKTTTTSFTITSTNQAPVIGTKTADATATNGSAVSVNAASAFSDPNTGDTITYAATGLPAGLTINASTGVISGTLTNTASTGGTAGVYAIAVTATDNKGAATIESFNLTATDVAPVVVAAPANQTTTDSATVSYPTAASFKNGGVETGALSYAATGLPAGLTINASTGVISGTLDHNASTGGTGGVYTVSETVTDAAGKTTTTSFTITSTNQAPTLGTPTANQAANDGAVIAPVDASKAFVDPNTGDVVTYSAAGLPAGLSINTATGVITGTVSATAAPGPYSITVTATDNKGAATPETFTWTIADVAPVTTTTLAAKTVIDGNAASIATATGFADPLGLPLTYSATGLPLGLTINASTGVISGTVDHNASTSGPYAVTVTVSDGQGGTAAQNFTITSTNQAPTLGTPTANQAANDGAVIAPVDASKAFVDPNTGDVVTYSAAGLPAGLSINTSTGVISGTVSATAAPGPYSITVTATDNKGAATPETFTWTIADVAPVTTTTLAAKTVIDGNAASIATATGFADPLGLPLTYSATGLPLGLTINASTGVISGTVDHNASTSGPYAVTVTVSDGQGGTAAQNFTITSTNQAPTLGTPTANQAANDGAVIAPVDASKAFVDPNTGDVVTYSAAGLPAGLSINTSTGVITGTVSATAAPGPYSITVTATDNKGAATPETFTWTIADVAPVTTTALPNKTVDDNQAATIDTSIGFADPLGLPLTYAATGLPLGLTINPITGVISGTVDPNASIHGPYTVTIQVSDGQGGTAKQTFIVTSIGQTSGPSPSLALNSSSLASVPAQKTVPVQLQISPIIVDTVNGLSDLGSLISSVSAHGIVDDTVNGVANLQGYGSATNTNGRADMLQPQTNHQFGADNVHANDLFEPAPFLGASAQSAAIFLSQSLQANGSRYGVEAVIRNRVLYLDVLDHHSQTNSIAEISVSMADGKPAPSWLLIDRRGLAFGKIPAGLDRVQLQITLTLKNGLKIQRDISVDLTTSQLKLLNSRDTGAGNVPGLTKTFAALAPRSGWNASHLAANLGNRDLLRP